MSGARWRLLLTASLFIGWLIWLAFAVSQKGTVQIVSRAQLASATHWVIAEITLGEDGLPLNATVKETLHGEPLSGTIIVKNLSASMTPVPLRDGDRRPLAGEYLLALERLDAQTFRIAGLPRSPGYEAQDMSSHQNPAMPLIYPWTDDVKKQIERLKR